LVISKWLARWPAKALILEEGRNGLTTTTTAESAALVEWAARSLGLDMMMFIDADHWPSDSVVLRSLPFSAASRDLPVMK